MCGPWRHQGGQPGSGTISIIKGQGKASSSSPSLGHLMQNWGSGSGHLAGQVLMGSDSDTDWLWFASVSWKAKPWWQNCFKDIIKDFFHVAFFPPGNTAGRGGEKALARLELEKRRAWAQKINTRLVPECKYGQSSVWRAQKLWWKVSTCHLTFWNSLGPVCKYS